ncbi:hypothetical protein NYV34_12685 [Escherichia coli]|nr:hypothetical protein [Escherichia coli]
MMNSTRQPPDLFGDQIEQQNISWIEIVGRMPKHRSRPINIRSGLFKRLQTLQSGDMFEVRHIHSYYLFNLCWRRFTATD